MNADPIAYTYEADTHCPNYAGRRFGRGKDGFIASESTDSEGNPVGVIAPWGEWQTFNEPDKPEYLVCGTCHTVIEEYVP